jgi:hypothetical protein
MSGQRMAWGWRMRSGCYVTSCWRRRLPVRAHIQLPVESMTVVLKVTATRLVDGKAGFKVPIVDLELPKPHPNEFSVRAARRSRLWRRSWVGLRRLQCSCSRVRGDACSLGQGSRESEAGQDAVVEAGHGADPAARKGED